MDTNGLLKILWLIKFVRFNNGGFSECRETQTRIFIYDISLSTKKNPQNLCELRNIVCRVPDTT
jgi:hypothetical protein